MNARLEDFPFDASRPATDVLRLEGLEKLRCVEDPGTRKALFDLYQRVVAPISPKPINTPHWQDDR